MELKKATRKQVKLRLGLAAVSGGGKTYSALLLAKGLVGSWNKIALIDTENGSGSLYENLGDYLTIELSAPFSPERYVEAINLCEKSGIECIIVDSISHEWEGEGGVLSLCDTIGGGFQNAWKQMTPRHERFKNAILNSSCHVITTVRKKQEYILVEEQNKAGKMVQKPVKAGMKEITRDNWEYELTVNFELDLNNKVSVSKDRTQMFKDRDPFVITENTGAEIKAWCERGIDPGAEIKAAKDAYLKLLEDTDLLIGDQKDQWSKGIDTWPLAKIQAAHKKAVGELEKLEEEINKQTA